jgi:multicomponent Na+:H+ antiporter subunit A
VNAPSLAVLVAVLFVAAAIVPLAYRAVPRLASALAVLVSAVCFGVFVLQTAPVARGDVLASTVEWVHSLGIDAAFRVDGLSLLFALMITGIGAIILAYAPAYMDHAPVTGRLLGLLLAFEASMLGLVLADDTIAMFVFWELTSFTSFFLVALDSTSALARTRARQALVVTAGGGLVLFVGLLLLASAAHGPGTIAVRFSELADIPLREHRHYAALVSLIAIGAFTKSAQFPFHFWLPGAMVAPSPVSAYLHSATMVKAGIYLLARLHPHLGGTALWIGLLATVGATTFLVGGVLATLQRDVKLTLAYATVAALGALTLLLGIGTAYALGGAVVLLLAHACYKAALFLTAGNLDHHRGTRDPLAPVDVRDMPVTAGVAAMAAASMAGVPPLLGFIAKDAIFAATVQGTAAVLVTVASVIAGAGLATAAWLAGLAPYFRGRRVWSREDVARPMLVGPVLLAIASLVFGLTPELVAGTLVTPALTAIAGQPVEYKVALWPGLAGAHGLAFLLGLVSIAIGAAFSVVVWRRRERIAAVRDYLHAYSGARVHESVIDAVMRGSSVLTRSIQHGKLPVYIGVIVATMAVLALLPLVGEAARVVAATDFRAGTYEIPFLLVAAVSVIAAAVFRDRLSSVAALAATGLAVTFLFAVFSGPDLAITQLTVETMMVILLVLVFRRLPPSIHRERPRHMPLRLAVAGASGFLVTLLLLHATAVERFEAEASLGQIEHGPGQEFTNIVNAILVNFRALDTLGEIVVLAIAGVGVAALAGARGTRGTRRGER